MLNVGAGAGSYEPADRDVVAVELSRMMIRQREAGRAPAVQASSLRLPFPDDSFDASLAILTMHRIARTASSARTGVAGRRISSRLSARRSRRSPGFTMSTKASSDCAGTSSPAAWERRHGRVLEQTTADLGYRLILAEP